MAYCNSTCQRAAWRTGHKEECRRLRDSSLSSAASLASRRNSGAEVGVTNSTAARDELQAAATSPFQAASICVSDTHGMVVDTDGQVRSWGSGKDFVVSHVISLPATQRAVSVSVGHAHSLVLTEAGSVFSFGQNDLVRAGLPPTPTVRGPSPNWPCVTYQTTPPTGPVRARSVW